MEKDKKFCGEKEPIFQQREGGKRGEVGNDNKNFKKRGKRRV